MAGETVITVIGNLTKDPELRVTPSGVSVAKFGIASTPRNMNKESQKWEDGSPLFLNCTVWRKLADNVAESLHKGDRVILSGKLSQSSYEKDGEKRTSYELQVEEIGASMAFATLAITKAASGAGRASGPVDDPWATSTSSGQSQEPPW